MWCHTALMKHVKTLILLKYKYLYISTIFFLILLLCV